jgi:oligosaccharide reducing-end xylanase
VSGEGTRQGEADNGLGSAGTGNILDSTSAAGASAGAGGASQHEPELHAAPLPPGSRTANLFHELLGVSEADVDAKIEQAVQRVFGLVGNEPNRPSRDSGYRLYYELPQDPSLAIIWAPDSNDIRSEGMSYGMMLALQMDLQPQFDRLWKFARTFMQFPADSSLSAWRNYFRWQGSLDTSNPMQWSIRYDPEVGPAPDGEQYFAAALYLADRRWGSDGVNYRQAADALSSAMLHNPAQDGRTPVFQQDPRLVVFYPRDGGAEFTDPSYHLPAFYELFAAEGPVADRASWQQIAETSRRYLVDSAHPDTGLHPDYADFDGSPNSGGSDHDQFRYDAWRVVMNMAIDGAWFGVDERLQAQVEKYHAFFADRLNGNDVQSSLFSLDGSFAAGNGSTALTATLASGALISRADNRARFVQNLWRIPQQTGTYRYYQETVYLLGLLSTGGRYAQRWSP